MRIGLLCGCDLALFICLTVPESQGWLYFWVKVPVTSLHWHSIGEGAQHQASSTGYSENPNAIASLDTLYRLCVEKFAFWLVIYIKTSNTYFNEPMNGQDVKLCELDNTSGRFFTQIRGGPCVKLQKQQTHNSEGLMNNAEVITIYSQPHSLVMVVR